VKEKTCHRSLERQEKEIYEKKSVGNTTSPVKEAHGGETCLAGALKPQRRGPREAVGGWPLAFYDATMISDRQAGNNKQACCQWPCRLY